MWKKKLQKLMLYITDKSCCTCFNKKAYPSPGRGERVVLIDFGMKHGILRELNKRDCDVIVVPYNTSAEEILICYSQMELCLSNGPGNPEDVEECSRNN